MHPSYTVFHKATETFSCIWTPWQASYPAFLQAYEADLAQYGQAACLSPKPGRPGNTFDVSMLPWTDFSGFNINVYDPGMYMLPIFTLGQASRQEGKVTIPLAIHGVVIKADGEKLLGTGVRILRYLGKNPDKIRQARRFFTYYLDTAAKLLARYVEFQETQVSSREVSGILERTARALPVLNEAFENQFTHLMEGELLDVEADIELLESTLKMEGGK